MNMKIFSLLIVAASAAAITGCGSSRAAGVQDGARTILVAVDRSKSMYLNDPAGLGPESLQAMIALAPPGANFGVVAYGEEAQELAPITSLHTRRDRAMVAQAAAKLELKGKTDFDVAFKAGSRLFDQTNAPDGSSLILLTDGQHNHGDTGVIFDTARSFTESNWKINALAVTPSRRISFIEKVAEAGGGQAYRIDNAQQSLDASLQLAADAKRMFAFLSEYAPEQNVLLFYTHVTILPGTENLLLVALKKTPDAGFLSMNPLSELDGCVQITRDSEPVYAYPTNAGGQVPFDIVNVLSPAPGVYEIITQGTASSSYVLCNLPVSVSFVEDTPKELYEVGEAVRVTVEVSTDNQEIYELMKASGTVEISAVPKGAGNTLTKVLNLAQPAQEGTTEPAEDEEPTEPAEGEEPTEPAEDEEPTEPAEDEEPTEPAEDEEPTEPAESEEPAEPAGNGKFTLVFEGNLPLFAGGSEAVEFALTATFAVRCADDGVWLRRERAVTRVTPGGSALAAEPSELDFGHHWSHEEAISREFDVGAIYPGKVAVKVTEVPEGFQVEPPQFVVTDKPRQKVTVTLDPAKVIDFGDRELTLLLTNTILDADTESKVLPVVLRSGVYKIEIPERMEAAAHPGKKFKQPVPVTVTPLLKFTYELSTLSSATGSLEAKVVQDGEEGEVSLAFDVPLNTDDGTYKGELKMTPEIEGLIPQTIKVSLSVSGAPQVFVEPKELKFQTNKGGWVEETVTVWAEHYEDVDFGVTIKDIESKAADMLISGQFDAEFVPLDGWDGKKLQPAQKRKAKLRFFVSTDLQSGSYAGEAEIWIGYRGDKKTTVTLPVSIELSR